VTLPTSDRCVNASEVGNVDRCTSTAADLFHSPQAVAVWRQLRPTSKFSQLILLRS